jgi:diguanylate cyclase (GGDEF)-like protein
VTAIGAPPALPPLPPTAHPAPQAPLSDRIRAERLQVLFRQAPPAIVISAVVGVMVCAVLWDVDDRPTLLVWLVSLCTLALGRGALAIAYGRRSPESRNVRRWERWFVATALLVAAAWGTGGWLLMPPASSAHAAMLYFFLIGLVGGTVATYVAHVWLVSASITLVLLPATALLFARGPFELRLMALGGVIFLIAAYRATNLLAFFLRRAFQLSEDLSLAHALAQELARTDELTGMNNRRAFLELAEHSLQQAERYDRPLSLVLFDLDGFKAINDAHGHAAGDEVLRTVAEVVRNTIRTSDVAGRLGGEEFGVLLPETDAAAALVIAERLRAGFAATPARGRQATLRFTASFGVVERDGANGPMDELLARADSALYQAKARGRDRVEVSARKPAP